MYQYFSKKTHRLVFANLEEQRNNYTDLLEVVTTAPLPVQDDTYFYHEKGEIKESSLVLEGLKFQKMQELDAAYNASKKITIQNGKTLIVNHDTPERPFFLKLIEDVSNLSTTTGAALIYKQTTDLGVFVLRILPEIAAYIFKDLFVETLANRTKVNSRIHNKTTIYEFALEEINKATTKAQLDAVKWSFLTPDGVVIDVNNKATQMLSDPDVSVYTKQAINAAKDPATGEIHLVKTLQELAVDS